MRKTREVLRLHYDLKLGQRQIARSVQISQSTVHEYLARFAQSGLSWPPPTEVGEAQLEAALFPAEPVPEMVSGPRAMPDFAHVHQERQEHKHTTLQLLGKSTGRRIRKATATAAFVITTSSGSSKASW